MQDRQNFGTNQEVVSSDLSKIPPRLERGMYDYVIRELMARTENAFFQDSFSAVYTDAVSILIKAGLGFQNIATENYEPVNKPIYREVDFSVNFNAADVANDRIDIVVAKYKIVNGEEVTRRFKDVGTGEISDRQFIESTGWDAELLVVDGVAAGSPVAPAVPAGYLKIHTVLIKAAVGIENQAAITDNRNLLPICTDTSAIGSYEYDAVVGSVLQANFASLAAALISAQDGWKILVLEDETINTGAIPLVNNNNIEIVFKRGASLTKGTAASGLQVDGDDCKIVNGRLVDFTTSGVVVSATANRTILDAPRFNNCATNIDDQGDQTFVNVEYEE